jgi:hypothetical protein
MHREDHHIIACLNFSEPFPKCAKCGMFHKIENSRINVVELFKFRSFGGFLLEET